MSDWNEHDIPELEEDEIERVAIIGMAGRFPGARNLAEFWRNLRDGVEGISWFSEEELAEAGIGREELANPSYVKASPVLEEIDQFDAGFFGYTPREAEVLDPQQRLFLETVWEALENAGWDGERHGRSTGLFAGSSLSHYLMNNLRDRFTMSEMGFESLIGNDKDYLASRVAYKLDLGGPSVGVQSACSTSLVAVHSAAQALLSFECDMAVAGGVTVRLPPKSGYLYQEGGLFAPDGRCRPFDAEARGTIFGSGVGAIVLKRLGDALRDGDRIRAVILGSAVNNDGSRKVGYTAPGEFGQVRVIGEALEMAGIEPETVGYIETHGTGTALGDPIEAAALKQAYRDVPPERKIALGAVKSNVGHLECAAGIAGLIKTVLAMEHRQLPPTLHFKQLNPHIDFARTPFYVNAQLRDWHGDEPRRAGISSFGIGGTNAHIILEEAPEQETVPAPGAPYLLPISARSEASLHELTAAYIDKLSNGVPAGSIAATAARSRAHHGHRLALVGRDRESLIAGLEAYQRGEQHGGANWGQANPDGQRKVVFVYPGQGSQWRGMARRLLLDEPVFREAMEACDAAIQHHTRFTISDVLHGKLESRFEDVDVIQPALFAVSVALTALWRHWGIEPDALIGHSQGEIAAAYVAGVLTLEEAARVICLRSALIRGIEGKGAMAVAELSVEAAVDAIAPHGGKIALAAVNSPRGAVLSGEATAIAQLLEELEARGIYGRKINVTYGSHCNQVEPILNQLTARLAGLKPQTAKLSIYSTVTADLRDGTDWDAAYWARNLRQPVHFAESLRKAWQDGHEVYLEVSAHPVLTHAVRDTLTALQDETKSSQQAVVSGSLRRDEDERTVMLEHLGALYAHGLPVKWDTIYPGEVPRVELPSYPWNRQRYWVDGAAGGQQATLTALGGHAYHPLLNGFVRSALHGGTWYWQVEISTSAVSYLADHVVSGRVIVPGTFYLELAQAAVWQAFGAETPRLERVNLQEALILEEEARYLLQIAVEEHGTQQASFHIATTSPELDDWRIHATGNVRWDEENQAEPASIDEIRQRCEAPEEADHFYTAIRGQGFAYGPSFRGMTRLQRGEGEALALLAVPERLGNIANYRLHPALLDACFQVLMAAAPSDGNDDIYLPVGIEETRLYTQPKGELWAHGSLHAPEGSDRASGDLWVYDSDGNPVFEVHGLAFQKVSSGGDSEMCYLLDWVETGAGPGHDRQPKERQPCRWLLLADAGGEGERLAQGLRAHGEQVELVKVDQYTNIAQALQSGEQPWCGLVYLWGLDAAEGFGGSAEDLERATRLGCDTLQQLSSALEGEHVPQVTIITRGGYAVGARTGASSRGTALLAQAPLLATAATLANERPDLKLRMIDLEPGTVEAASRKQERDHVVHELLGADGENRVAYRGNRRFAARLVQDRGDNAGAARQTRSSKTWRLETQQPGNLNALQLHAFEPTEPGPNEVAIAVKATGLNFLDVLSAMGRRPDAPEGPTLLGTECSGIITAIGSDVRGLDVGAEVVALAHPAFASHVTVPATFVTRKPKALTFDQAAAMLIGPMTAYYALHQLARLQAGEKVLIHSATGGTGLAALRLAQEAGAEIYATAGNDEKRAWLRVQGVAYVGNSRDTRFAEEILAATNGVGVDVVLNALSGEAMQRSLDVVAPYGRFVEIGKADIYGNTRLGMWPFHKNIAYYSLDLARMMGERPEQISDLLRQVLHLIEEGTLAPLPVTSYPMTRAIEAFGHMARATHIGKLTVVNDRDELEVVETQPGVQIRDDRAYLITGGLGGLGLTFAGWLAEQGARHLVLLGRNAPKPEAASKIAKWQARGIQVQTPRADVADSVALGRVFDELTAPLGGILHAAGTLDDAPLHQLDPQRFRKVMAPKVQGGWNLHHHLERGGHEPDFFVLFSSVASLNGTPGQANYAAANGFMDALAHHRRAHGKPALSINWGGWAQVGMAAESFTGAGANYGIDPDQGTALVGRLLKTGAPAQVAVTPTPVPHWLGQQVCGQPLFSLLEKASDRKGEADLQMKLETSAPEERRELLESYLIRQVAAVLRIPATGIRPDVGLNTYGLTSLFALELRNRVESDLGLPIQVIQFFQCGDLRTFANKLLERMALSALLHDEETNEEEDYDEITI